MALSPLHFYLSESRFGTTPAAQIENLSARIRCFSWILLELRGSMLRGHFVADLRIEICSSPTWLGFQPERCLSTEASR